MALITIWSALLVHIGVSLYAGAKVFDYFFGIPVLYSIIIIAVVTAVYTILGGLNAIVVTDTIQAVLLLGGCVLLTVFALARLPGTGIHSFAAGLLAAVMSTVEAALNSTATVTAEDIVRHIRPQTKDGTIVLIGRVTACVVIVLAMLWSPYCERFRDIFVVINKVPMMFAPAITTYPKGRIFAGALIKGRKEGILYRLEKGKSPVVVLEEIGTSNPYQDAICQCRPWRSRDLSVRTR